MGIQARQEMEQFSPYQCKLCIHNQSGCAFTAGINCSVKEPGLAEQCLHGGKVFWCEWAFLLHITRKVQPLSPYTHLLSSSLAGDASVLDQLSCPASTASTELSTSCPLQLSQLPGAAASSLSSYLDVPPSPLQTSTLNKNH